MHTTIHVSDPENFEVKLRDSYSQKPSINLSVTNDLRVTCHGVTDEQMVVAYSAGLIERMSLIHQRSHGAEPFISLVIAFPGVEITYFWIPDEIDTDDAEGLLRALAELLVDAGEFDTLDAARIDIRRRTGLTSAAGGEGEEIGGVPSSAPMD